MAKSLLVLGLIATTLVVVINAQSKAHENFCERFDGDCDDCLKASNDTLDQGGSCYYCKETSGGDKNRCLAIGFTLPIAATSDCPGLNYNIGTCTVPAIVFIVIIVIFVVIFFVFLITCCCICCCWCSRRRQRQREAEEEQYAQEKDAIRQKSANRKMDRRTKNDEIRKKYGLTDDTTGTYKRLE